MIGRLQGRLLSKQPPQLLVDVNGVGYEVEAPMSTIYDLPAVGENVVLHTHLAVREDAQQLFGFASEQERSLFRDLIKVSGVGGKVALAILSGISVSEFVFCVQANDSARLVKVPGIGKKTAERLIIEMRDKLGDGESVTLPSAGPQTAQGPVAEAHAALVALGYKPADASKMLDKVAEPDMDSEALIRAALKGAAG